MITDELKQIAYNEGYKEFLYGVKVEDNPYIGVSSKLSLFWDFGWWHAKYDE